MHNGKKKSVKIL